MKPPKSVTVWAWALKGRNRWELCYWCSRTKRGLLDGGSPSPEAKPMRVRMCVTGRKR